MGIVIKICDYLEYLVPENEDNLFYILKTLWKI